MADYIIELNTDTPVCDRGRAEGGAACAGQVPADHSLLYSLMTARRKDNGQPLSELHICSQAFTFVLAGALPVHACILIHSSSTVSSLQGPNDQ